MTKMEALEDVKKTLTSTINKLETYIFIQDINVIEKNESIEANDMAYDTK